MATDDSERTGARRSGPTRRDCLAAVGTATTLAVAGCSGGGDGGDGDGDGGGDGATRTRTTETPGSGPANGGDDCGPSSIAYRTVELTNPEVDGPIATVDLPEDATLDRMEYTVDVELPYGDPGAEFNVEPTVLADATIQGLVEAGEVDPDNEITDRFDPGGSGRRVFTLLATDDEVPRNTIVYVPDGSGVLVFNVTLVTGGCEELPVYERMVTSVEPA